MRRLLTVLAAVLLWGGVAQATVVLQFTPGTKDVAVGSTFTMDLRADVPNADALVGWGGTLLYDPSLVRLDGVSFGLLWDSALYLGGDTLVTLLLPNPTSPDPGASGQDLQLAQLTFACLGVGTTRLGMAIDLLDPVQGFMRFDGNYADLEIVDAEINQVTVPEPGTFLLLLTGLAGCLGLRRLRS
ncbi:hypothetical protein GMST_18930 [Geomonas silvestris]|uniref:Ice-binding protein C-terminal domain-containing protein n=1 Tax=Geomonas silvestris TaxID=2740184 RepID=A0A6V8MHU8_9BACT|nr:cohesin domain-containing protein [Geomonas silvestris]GFO59568.1 hypothetical protein GMST_18930 [Geomonas silvestris]